MSGGTLAILCAQFTIGGGVAIRSHVYEIYEDIQSSQPDYIFMYSNGYLQAYKNFQEYLNKLSKDEKEKYEALIAKKIELIDKTHTFLHPDIDNELKPLRESLFGRNIKVLLCVGAALPPGVLYTLRAIAGIPFDNYYSTTETSPISIGETGDPINSVGPPVATRKLKLIDVPQLGYRTTDKTNGVLTPRGEVFFIILNIKVACKWSTFLWILQEPRTFKSKV